MMCAYEELPPEDPIWTSLENSVQFLLFKLSGKLKTGFLSHYFIHEINLLERVGEDVRRNSIAIISRWQDNVLMSTPADIPEKLEFMNSLPIHYSEKKAIQQRNLLWQEMFNTPLPPLS